MSRDHNLMPAQSRFRSAPGRRSQQELDGRRSVKDD
jgi:hypothetical protein